jgi:hypothetical protein
MRVAAMKRGIVPDVQAPSIGRRWTAEAVAATKCGPLNRSTLGKPDDEAALQRQCETFLDSLGYKRMTAVNAQKTFCECAGWYGHLNETERNPLMPDLWIFAQPNVRPPLLVELKVRNVYQSGQKEMIARGMWIECRTLAEFAETVLNWSKK